MAVLPVALRFTQVLGISGALWLAGNIAALSLISVPALQESGLKDQAPRSMLARQWKYTYENGRATNPPVAAVVASSFGYLAWYARASSAQHHLVPKNSGQLYCTAAVLAAAIMPYTILFMSSTNNKLIAKATASSKDNLATDGEVDVLLAKWKSLNAVRSLLPLTAGILGLGLALA